MILPNGHDDLVLRESKKEGVKEVEVVSITDMGRVEGSNGDEFRTIYELKDGDEVTEVAIQVKCTKVIGSPMPHVSRAILELHELYKMFERTAFYFLDDDKIWKKYLRNPNTKWSLRHDRRN